MRSKQLTTCTARGSTSLIQKGTQQMITDYVPKNFFHLSNYSRCLLEDFMLLNPKSKICILCPQSHKIRKDDSLKPVKNVAFNKDNFKVYYFVLHSNIKLDDVQTGIDTSELTHGSGKGNYDVTFLYQSDDGRECYTQLVTWK